MEVWQGPHFVRVFWAPGRVNFIGEFTDLVGGLVLPAALDLGIRLSGVAADAIELRSAGQDEAVRLAADGSGAPRAWGRYVAAVARELALLGRAPIGFRGELESSLPIGAGLSSSAALEVAVATALCAVADFELAPLELAQAARRAENRLGIPSGILDQAACVLGRADHAILLDTRSLEHELVPLPPRLAVVIVDSGVRRALEHSGYAERKRELDRGDRRRLRHVETENERVVATAAALRANDLERVGELFREGHESLRVDFEATIPELDRLVDLAYAEGAIAARMTGGGFGGAIVALVDRADVEAFVERLVREYGAGGRAWICRASDGARELVPNVL